MPTQPITLGGVAGFKVKLKNTTKFLGLNESNEFIWTDETYARSFDSDWYWDGSSRTHMVYENGKVKTGTNADTNWQARANVNGKEFQLPYQGSPTKYLGQDAAGNVVLQDAANTLVEVP